MLVKTEGIVIRKVKFSESSFIVTIYTSKYGMTGFHIPGVYSKKGQMKPSYFFPLQMLEIDFYLRENQNLKKVKEVRPAVIYRELHTDFQKTTIALLIAELLFKTIREEEENEDLYDFLREAFLLLDSQQGKPGNFLLSFLLKLSAYLGFYPTNNFDSGQAYFHLLEGKFMESNYDPEYSLEREESEVISTFLQAKLAANQEIEIRSALRKKVFEQMLRFYSLHIESFVALKSEKVLKEMFRQL